MAREAPSPKASGRSRTTRAVAGFDPIPSRRPEDAVTVEVVAAVPEGATVIGIPTFSDGAVPERVPLDRATLEASGFAAARGQTLLLPRVDGATIIETGVGSRATVDLAAIRDAAAAFAMAAVRHEHLVVDLTGLDLVDPATAGQAVVEGVPFPFDPRRADPSTGFAEERYLGAAFIAKGVLRYDGSFRYPIFERIAREMFR